MWYFMPIPYVIINTGSKYRLTFYVKQRQKRQPLGAAFLGYRTKRVGTLIPIIER